MTGAGKWLTTATPSFFTSGDCTGAPPLPDLVVGADGSLAVYNNGTTTTPCEAMMPSVASCQTFGLCLPWEINLNFRGCTAGATCQGGLASEFTSHGDGGRCAVSFTLTPIGP
jgi:hypothetical protein